MTRPRRLRAYALTGGRTHVDTSLSMGSMLVATRPADPTLGPEHRTILDRCARPQSLVDLSAALAMPLGVLRVLLTDLLATGHVDHHSPDSHEGAAPVHQDLTVLGELLDGIEAL